MSPSPRTPREGATICEAIEGWAATQPAQTALMDSDGAAVSYRDLVERMGQIRRWLAEAGFGHGDRIAIAEPGGIDMTVLLLGVMQGAAAAPLDSHLNHEDAATLLRQSAATAVLVASDSDAAARSAGAELGLPILEVESAEPNAPFSERLKPMSVRVSKAPAPAGGDDLSLLLTTSGTTAERKIVPIRHRHIMARSSYTAGFLELRPDDRCINLNAMFLHGGVANMAAALYAGGSVVFLRSFSVERFFHCLEALSPTWYAASYTYNHAIRKHAASHGFDAGTTTLRFIRTTSGPLDSEIAEGLEAAFGVPVIEAYATTETGRIAGNPRPPGMRKRGTVGLPTGGEVAVIDEEGNFLAAGETGEVVVRGPHVFDGYEDDPEANADAFIDGWFRTGDLGWFDQDGYLTLTGRIKEMINRGGEKVSPAKIDAAMMGHPDVREAAAFPVAHPTLGEEIAAVVVSVPGSGLSAVDLRAYLLERLAGFETPKAIVFAEAIPRSPGGKVQRNKLSETFGLRIRDR